MPAHDPRRERGQKAEAFVDRYLRRHGYKILARNVRSSFGELDIIALDGDVVCFVEVRSRTSTHLGEPYETVGYHKQRKLRALADAYLERNHPDKAGRFDVASVVWGPKPELTYIPDAFE